MSLKKRNQQTIGLLVIVLRFRIHVGFLTLYASKIPKMRCKKA